MVRQFLHFPVEFRLARLFHQESGIDDHHVAIRGIGLDFQRQRRERIEQGSLAENMVQKLKEETDGRIEPILEQMQWCLKENRPYFAEMERCG